MPTHPQRPLVLKTGVQFTVKLRYVFPFPFFCREFFISLASYSWGDGTHYTVAKVLRSGGCLLSKFNLCSGFTLYQVRWQSSVWEIQADSRSDTCRLFFPCNSFANLFLPLKQELGSVLQTANVYCHCTRYLVQSELGARTCSWAVLLKYTWDKQHYIIAVVFCSCSHLFFFKSLCRLLVKLQELNYNLKVKVLFDKYVVFFSFFSMRKQSRPHVQKSRRQPD